MKSFLFIISVLFAAVSQAKETPVKPKTTPDQAKVAANCAVPVAMAELDINNVRAKILGASDLWWDLNNAGYEVPAGSGKHAMFAGALWIGGIDAGGQIKVAAQTYRQTGGDFWTGAIDTVIVNIQQARCSFYDRHWKINRQEVVDFVNNGTTTPDIISWPGNGDALYNEGHYLAPFVDANGDGIYNYLDGDYPGYNLSSVYPVIPNSNIEVCNDYIFGDQTIWWVINDVGNAHTETSSLPIGLEIRCQAFAFQSTLPAIDNATFYKYQLINRSSSTYTDTYFGQWVDPDLGNAVDDYVGCNVPRGLGYCYNGDPDDETASGYGIDPPAVGVDFLQGPYADVMDGIDNDMDGCLDCTFIDSSGTIIVVPDVSLPEGISMAKFVYYNNVNNSPVGNPNGFADFYNYLKGIWLDNQPITYGGDGRNPGNPICNYMFPGTSDPANPTDWTETTAGNPPEDRRFLQSAGQFTLSPGQVHYITTGVIWARQISGGPLGSVALLEQYDDQVQQLFSQCFRLTGVGLNETNQEASFEVFPNPSNDYINIKASSVKGICNIKIFDTTGKQILIKEFNSNEIYQLNTSTFASGTYLYQLQNENNLHSGKFVIH